MAHKSLFNWSGGKDSALALFHTLRNPDYEIQQLLTSINGTYDRVSMHGVRTVLLEQQAAALGLPLTRLLLADQPSMHDYEKAMETTMATFREAGYTHSVFGDIFLEDLRRYREEKLAAAGFSAYFPLWKRDTTELIHEFLDLGFKTIVVCTKSELLDSSFAGRIIDHDFLKDLPAGVDPCGENGEFHTFVFDGPIFKQPVAFETGEKVYREYKAPQSSSDNCGEATGMGFWFCDLLPAL
ncbi:diphthine--ammonia ligase [Sediminibacterium ginsengisoli]|uniref:MJ0570-related uncharacterized domain-containing protein n=1 Tax=Sediminibacterium ginsengisoli TaxID=413434 RepID=A0A1T4JVF3_9BACT|nr:diphthine--ammonia ligase [Sediminibacterium ginsengisoli]SJZ34075.1 MJ0570-related uncharacterized domain-containing protein [Sediminibacterium ginsengisoli]